MDSGQRLKAMRERFDESRALFLSGILEDADIAWLLENLELALKALKEALPNGKHVPPHCPAANGATTCKCWVGDAQYLVGETPVRFIERGSKS